MKRNKNNLSLILVSVLSILYISIFLNNVSAEEFNAKELGLKFEYDKSWNLVSGADSSKCDKTLCIFTLKNLNDNNTSLAIWVQKGHQFKNICKCDSLVEFVQYDYTKYYEPIKTFSLINDNQTTFNDNITAMQMEYTSGVEGNTQFHYLISWIKNNDIFYKIAYQSDNNSFNQFLSNAKNILNSIELFDPNKKIQSTTSNEFQSISERKKPSFMIPHETEENQEESLNQLDTTDQQSQQQFSELTLYEDPEGRFTLEYDPSLWIAIPDRNRFDEIELTFADKETGGKDVGMTLGSVKDPTPNLSIREATELAVPSYIGNNKYEDKQLEEGVECEKMTIQGYDTCSFIFSKPKSYFESYPRTYFMMVNAKVGDELWIISFSARGDKFTDFEQNVIHMINSVKISNVQQTSEITSQEFSNNENLCNPISGTIPLHNQISPNGIIILGNYGNCKLKDGIVTLNMPNEDNLKFVALNIDQNIPTNSEGAVIEINQTNGKSSKNNQISKVILNKEMTGTDPQTDKPIEISEINGLALYNVGKRYISFNQNNVNVSISFQ